MADVITLLSVSANTTSAIEDAGDLKDEVSIFVEAPVGVTAFSVQFSGSMDGVNFLNVGSAITAVTPGTVVTGLPLLRYFRAALTGYTGSGTLTAKLAFGKT